MSRLNESAVHAAIDGLVGAKRSVGNLSARAIQTALGGGSLSTITKYRETREAAIANPKPSVAELVRTELKKVLADPEMLNILIEAQIPTGAATDNAIQKLFTKIEKCFVDIQERLVPIEYEINGDYIPCKPIPDKA